MLATALPAGAQTASSAARPGLPAAAMEPSLLTVWNQPIVTLRAQIDALTPQLRVERAAERIARLEHAELGMTVTAVPEKVGRVDGYAVRLGERTLFSLLPQDLDPEATEPLRQVAETAAQHLATALRARIEQRRLPVLARGIGLTLAATAALVLGLWLIEQGRRRLRAQLARIARGPKIDFRGVDLRPYLQVVGGAAIQGLRTGFGIALGYFWLSFVLVQFPYSEPWGNQLGIWLRDLVAELAGGALGAIPGLFTVAVIFIVARIVAQLAARFFRSVEAGWLSVDWIEAETAKATRRLVIVLIWVFALVVAYPYIPGSHTAAFQGISVLLGLMVSLGAAGFVNQVMSGLVVAYSRSVRTGEFVEVGNTQGTVAEVGVLATKLVTPTQQEVTIPNAVLVSSSLTNFSRHADSARGAIISTSLTIGYDTPWRQVEALLLEAARRTTAIRLEPPPRVIQRSLDDFYVAYRLIFSIDRPEEQLFVLSDLHGHTQDVFAEQEVQIMSPHFTSQPAVKVVAPTAGGQAARWPAVAS